MNDHAFMCISPNLSKLHISSLDGATACRIILKHMLGHDQGKNLRVLSYNIHGWRDTDHVDNLDRLIEVISSASPDVVVLQEVLHPYEPPGTV
jgi:hypothetical protein